VYYAPNLTPVVVTSLCAGESEGSSSVSGPGVRITTVAVCLHGEAVTTSMGSRFALVLDMNYSLLSRVGCHW
jgi:hypothetical protein